jgi:hypothetical protein
MLNGFGTIEDTSKGAVSMNRDENWAAKADFHQQKMKECKAAFTACFKAFREDPSKRPILDAVWQEYERHKERFNNCTSMARGEHELPSRS